MNDINRLKLLTRSFCKNQDGTVNSLEEIHTKMRDTDSLICELADKSMLSIAFDVIYKEKTYFIVFVSFPESAIQEADVDVMITPK